MSFLKELLNETRKINEEDLFPGTDAGQEVIEEEPVVDEPAPEDCVGEECPEEEVACDECPEVTDELIAELTEAIPEIADVEPEEFRAGLTKELQSHFTTVNDVNVIARVTLDHLNQFPGKDYYGALATMEASLAEEEEVPAEEPVGEEPPAEDVVPAEEEPAFTEEKPVEEAKALSQRQDRSGETKQDTPKK